MGYKCQKCGGSNVVPLLTSLVCDDCDPPSDGVPERISSDSDITKKIRLSNVDAGWLLPP